MELPLFFALALFAVLGLIVNWGLEKVLHNRRLQAKSLRIHVNGIRGKSTVTRIIAGMLRHEGINTIAKTTGSAACVIDEDGVDHPIQRNGSPTILEQVAIVRSLPSSVEAIVMECMAIKPEYQRICEEKIIQSNIGVITNVREDHQDVLGFSLKEIANNLLSTCPFDGVLITSEQNSQLLPLFRMVANRRNTRLIIVDPNQVTDEDVAAFPYIAFKENIAIALAIADELGFNRQHALEGMIHAAPDPGVLRIERKSYEGRQLVWADLFAVNDRESVIACVNRVTANEPTRSTRIGLLNNRADREQRALQFARIAAQDIQFDYIALLGSYERKVEAELLKSGYAASKIIRLGESRGYFGESLVHQLLEKTSSKKIILMGLVNIHTLQAESLREWFHEKGLSDELC